MQHASHYQSKVFEDAAVYMFHCARHQLQRFRPHGRRYFGSRPRRTVRRAELASARRVEKKVRAEEAKGGPNKESKGEQVLSEKGMKWGFFFSLGIFPLFAFSVAVSTTPHLREQFNEMVASVTASKNSDQTRSTLSNDNNKESS